VEGSAILAEAPSANSLGSYFRVFRVFRGSIGFPSALPWVLHWDRDPQDKPRSIHSNKGNCGGVGEDTSATAVAYEPIGTTRIQTRVHLQSSDDPGNSNRPIP
jgi:hypothetical protein